MTMKLLKLYSDNPKFKTLTFNDGLNVVAGIQLTDDGRDTINGVGKSFTLNLIHYIFGATILNKEIKDFLANYGLFYLEFSVNDVSHIVCKNFGSPRFSLNKVELSKAKYMDKLGHIVLGRQASNKVSFRQIFNMFARRYGKSYYADALTQQGLPANNYYQILANLELLGLETDLLPLKVKNKDQLNHILELKKGIENSKLGFDKLDINKSDVNLVDIKDQLKKLVEQKDKFIVAPNYDELQMEADLLTELLNGLRNNIYDLKKKINRKNKSINDSEFVEVDDKKIEHIFKEANHFFPKEVSKTLADVNLFHKTIMSNRVNRLTNEVDELAIIKGKLQLELGKKEIERDKLINKLGALGALDEYSSLVETIREKERIIYDLERFDRSLQELELTKSNLKLESAQIKKDSLVYISNQSSYIINTLETKFRKLVKTFYNDKGGRLSITDALDAKYVFDINVQVPQQDSQGVNEVKIFCYDMLLYQLNPTRLGFLAHDGCIFSEMDPRQKSTIFKVVLDNIETSGLQYFVNIGQSSLNEVLDFDNKSNVLTSTQILAIKNSIILELYDNKPEATLFGEKFG